MGNQVVTGWCEKWCPSTLLASELQRNSSRERRLLPLLRIKGSWSSFPNSWVKSLSKDRLPPKFSQYGYCRAIISQAQAIWQRALQTSYIQLTLHHHGENITIQEILNLEPRYQPREKSRHCVYIFFMCTLVRKGFHEFLPGLRIKTPKEPQFFMLVHTFFLAQGCPFTGAPFEGEIYLLSNT